MLPFGEKRQFLDKFGIGPERYYQISGKKPLPQGFFRDLDMVQIASPVEYHKDQTTQALEEGKAVVTEKSFASDREDFEEIMRFIGSRGFSGKAFVHLHYLRKMPTMRLAEVLDGAVRKYGRIQDVQATFFEDFREEDKRRRWLFTPANGGIFLDWIHPVEVISHICKASFEKCLEAKTFIVTPEYGEHPSAALGTFRINGPSFASGATATVRVGKGFQSITHKVLRLNFEGAFLELGYIDSEIEMQSGLRGSIRLVETGSTPTEVMAENPTGPISYDFLIKDMADMMEGKGPPLSPEEVRRIFEPVWMFNETAFRESPVQNARQVGEFAREGVAKTTAHIIQVKNR